MTREEFERALSDWLDDPADPELRARIEAAILTNAEFKTVRAEWVRLNQVVRAGQIELGAVDFEKLGARVRAAVDESIEDAALDRLLATTAEGENAVDW